jgi:hypothetical protein
LELSPGGVQWRVLKCQKRKFGVPSLSQVETSISHSTELKPVIFLAKSLTVEKKSANFQHQPSLVPKRKISELLRPIGTGKFWNSYMLLGQILIVTR